MGYGRTMANKSTSAIATTVLRKDGPSARTESSPKGKAKREEILRGTIELIVREGYRRQTLRDIGLALDIKPAHILYYFDSREELLQNVIELWDQDSWVVLKDELRNASGLDPFIASVRRNCDAPSMCHLFLSMQAEAIDPTHISHDFFKTRLARLQANVRQSIEDEQRLGTIAVSFDAALSARHLIALAEGLQEQALISGEGDAARDLTAAIEVLRGRAQTA
jgi:AcrR family transcriptional regulator